MGKRRLRVRGIACCKWFVPKVLKPAQASTKESEEGYIENYVRVKSLTDT
jgi:hypothetical protein